MSALIIVVLAPLLHGAMRKLRARLQGRPGPCVIQPYRDLVKLWRKEALLPEGARIAGYVPGLVLGVAATFAASLPMLGSPGAFFSSVDIVALVLLLAAGRFALTLAALETRSVFEGMAASREMTFAALTEPTLLIALFAEVAPGHGVRMDALGGANAFTLSGAAAFAALFLVILTETARIPIDNQETHYELTMIHEGLLLEFSGPHLAMLHLAAQIKQLCYLALGALLLPGYWWAYPLWILALGVAITFVETFSAKLRLYEIPQLLATAFLFAASSIAVRFFGNPLP